MLITFPEQVPDNSEKENDLDNSSSPTSQAIPPDNTMWQRHPQVHLSLGIFVPFGTVQEEKYYVVTFLR